MTDDHEEVIKYDQRLFIPLHFVCKILDVTKKDFGSLALANLLKEELDFITHNNIIGNYENLEEIDRHKKVVDTVKVESNNWVLNKKRL